MKVIAMVAVCPAVTVTDESCEHGDAPGRTRGGRERARDMSKVFLLTGSSRGPGRQIAEAALGVIRVSR